VGRIRNFLKLRRSGSLRHRSKKTGLLVLGAMIVVGSLDAVAFADSCPCCGQVYGDPAPGDQARVYNLRRQHEAQCCPNQSGGRSGGGGSAGGLLDAFSWGLQQGMAVNQRMQQQAMEQSTALNNAGVECSDRGDYDGAIRYYQEALRVHPGNPAAKRNLNLCYAIKAYERGVEYYGQGNWAMAVQAFREAEGYHHLDGYESYVKIAQESFQEQEQERQNQAQTAKAVDRTLGDMIADARTQDSPVYAPGSTSGLDFIQEKEPIISKGDRNSAPVVLDEGAKDQPSDLKGEEPRKGLKIKEVPRFILIPPREDPYSVSTHAEIVLDALEKGDKDWDRSINYLKGYLATKNPDNVKVQEALSYLEGMRVRSSEAEPPRKKALFDPEEGTSQGLLESMPPPKPGFLEKFFDREPEPPPPTRPARNPEQWRSERSVAVLEAVKQGNGDWQKSINYLETKVAANDHDFTSRSALQFLQGYCGYDQFIKEHASNSKAKK